MEPPNLSIWRVWSVYSMRQEKAIATGISSMQGGATLHLLTWRVKKLMPWSHANCMCISCLLCDIICTSRWVPRYTVLYTHINANQCTRVAGSMDARYPISSFAADVIGWAFFKNTFATSHLLCLWCENTTFAQGRWNSYMYRTAGKYGKVFNLATLPN